MMMPSLLFYPRPPSPSSSTMTRRSSWLLLLVLLLLGYTTITTSASSADYFDEMRFYSSVDKAMESVKQILDTTRNPKLALDDMDHKYDDKFALAEFLTNTVIAAQMNVFETLLGLDNHETFQKLLDIVHNDHQSITLRFQGEQTTHFVKEKEVDIVTNEPETQTDDFEITTDGEVKEKSKTTTTRIKQKLLETHWKTELKIELLMFYGTTTSDPNGDNVVKLLERESSRNYITTGDKRKTSNNNKDPPQKKVFDPLEVNLTWLFQMLSTDKAAHNKISQFSIDRSDSETCKTPRRNKDIQKAIDSLVKIQTWFNRLVIFFQSDIRQLHAMGGGYNHHHENSPQVDYHSRYWDFLDNSRKMEQSLLFHPIFPLLENSTVLSELDLTSLLQEQVRGIQQAKKQLEDDDQQQTYPSSLISATEAKILLACHHSSQLINQYFDSVNYIEFMLRAQLVRAIGKEVTSPDFDGFMKLHHQKLFDSPTYNPNLFVYSIRRDINHYPDGTLSIEARTTTMDGDAVEPVQTFVRKIPYNATTTTTSPPPPPPIYIPINAATAVEIRGDRYLHGWLQHRFGGTDSITNFRLAARANQFSNFMLLVGTMGGGGTKFQPTSAIILQNKDELLIPLLTEVIPNAKEFKDAIASLSPTQQNFAKAFRAMQLESSVFGVCVIQLKPQLERLLGLPKSSLLKEIQLTQDLMSLFVDYQIPSDLLSVMTHDYEVEEVLGTSNTNSTTTTQQKLDSVKENVQAVKDVIQKAKEEQLENEKLKKEMLKQKKYTTSAEGRSFPAPTSNAPTASPSGSPSGYQDYLKHGRTRNSIHTTSARVHAATATESTMTFSAMADEIVLEAAAATGQASAKMPPSSTTSRRLGREESNANREYDTAQGETTTSSSRKADGRRGSTTTTTTSVDHDFTLLPKILDSQIERLDPDGSLRSTIVKPDKNRWERTRKENLLMPSIKEVLSNPTIEQEQKKAFDLLDALSRSGSLPIDQSELHIVVVLSHCFEDDLMSTVISDNVNPIEKVERSSLLLASTIHGGTPIKELVGDDITLEQQHLVDTLSPMIDARSESEVE